MMREKEIKTEFIKLDSFLKYADIAGTGGEAKVLIQDGLVSVNGSIERQRGKKLRSGDIISVGNEEVTVKRG